MTLIGKRLFPPGSLKAETQRKQPSRSVLVPSSLLILLRGSSHKERGHSFWSLYACLDASLSTSTMLCAVSCAPRGDWSCELQGHRCSSSPNLCLLPGSPFQSESSLLHSDFITVWHFSGNKVQRPLDLLDPPGCVCKNVSFWMFLSKGPLCFFLLIFVFQRRPQVEK